MGQAWASELSAQLVTFQCAPGMAPHISSYLRPALPWLLAWSGTLPDNARFVVLTSPHNDVAADRIPLLPASSTSRLTQPLRHLAGVILYANAEFAHPWLCPSR